MMLGKVTIKTTNLLTVIFAVIVASLLVVSFANTAFALGSMKVDSGSLKGEVVAVNDVHNAQTLTLQSSQIGRFPNDKLNIFLNRSTKVKVCNANEPIKDIKVGHSATVKYHELGGVAVADLISERC